jgi:hypothetical protein
MSQIKYGSYGFIAAIKVLVIVARSYNESESKQI